MESQRLQARLCEQSTDLLKCMQESGKPRPEASVLAYLLFEMENEKLRHFVELLYFLDTGLPWWRLCLMPFCLHSLCLGQRISWCWTPREDAIGSLGCHWLLGVLYVSRTPQAPSSRFVV